MKQMKKTLSLLLALVMLLSLGSTALAGEVEEQVPVVVEEQQPVVVEEAPPVVEEQPVVEEAPPVVEEQPVVEPVPVEEPAPVVEEPPVVVNAIVSQPEDLAVLNGEEAVFSVAVSGSATFQWQYCKDGRTWKNLNVSRYGNGPELHFNAALSYNGYRYRAVVTFANGEVVTTKAAVLKVAAAKITVQPQDVTVAPGENAVFSAKASGSVKSYRWQYSKDGGNTWTYLSLKNYPAKSTLTVAGKEAFSGRLFRVVVTAADNSKVISNAVMLTVAEPTPELPEAPALVEMPARTLKAAPQRGPASEVGVEVDAPAGALPVEAELNVAPVDVAEYEELTKALLGDEIEIGYAVDISFSTPADGEIEPVQGNPVIVYLTVPGLSEREGLLQIVHISDSGNATRVDLVPESELPRALGENEIAIKSDEFSVYELTWTTAGETPATVKSTIYWGRTVDGNFVEMDSTESVSLDTSASTISLENAYEGYYVLNAAYYESASAETGVDITKTLYKTADGTWQYNQIITDTSGNVSYEKKDIEDGSVIRVFYYKPGGSEVHPSSSDIQGEVPSPETTKDVTKNPDGTYTITLDIKGNTVAEDESHYANVLIILDRTYSMGNTMGSTTRWAAAKDAIDTLLTTLVPEKDWNKQTGNSNKIDLCLVGFGGNYNGTNDIQTLVSWTKDENTFKNYVDNTLSMVASTRHGTNWQGGFTQGQTAINSVPDSDPLFVIFVTDGQPNCTNTRAFPQFGTPMSASDAAAAAMPAAKAIATRTDTYLYGVFCGASTNSDEYRLLNSVITGEGQGGVKTIAADDPATIRSEFGKIAETILDFIGVSGVSVDDGVPSLASVSANVAGEAGGFVYQTSEDGSTWSDWAEAPGASYSQANGVTWDLSEVGTVQAGSWYRLKFTVWPSQEAYDLIADLNNGLVTKTEAELDALGIEKNADGVYYLLTNTHLNTTYIFDGQTITDPTDPDDLQKEEMILPTTTIKVVKYWNNDLDDKAAIETAKILVMKGDEVYDEVALGTVTQISAHRWKQTPSRKIYISMGQLTLNTETDVIEVISSGHDYTVKEPSDYSYNWWLTADVYHPMLVNGVPTVLIKVRAADLADAPTLDDNKHLTSGGKEYFKFNGILYVAQDADENLLEATNDRRSNLNVTKVVTGENAPADAYFTYSVTVTDSEGEDVWFSIFTAPENGTIVKDSNLVTGATAESGNTGYWYMTSGSTATVKIKAGWNIRVMNLPNGSEYEIVEVEDSMEPGWVFTKAESSIVSDYQATPASIDGSTASGTIDMANTKYIVTYTNEYVGLFYVYHSADCSVEQIPMATGGVAYSASNPFNIFAKTYEGTLYGGYYSDYAGKSSGFDAAALTYKDGLGSDADGTPYSLAYIKESSKAAWSSSAAYGVDGTAITPVKDTVYFLKEVPTAYLQPYTYFTYYKAAPQNIAALWTISALDDLNYTGAGFYIEDVQTGTTNVVSSLSIKAANSTTTVKLTASKCFGIKQGILDGYLSYVKINDMIGSKINIWQYWTTPDGIEVCGIVQRELDTTSGTKASVGYNDTAYPGT